jgi:hypothetical protein
MINKEWFSANNILAFIVSITAAYLLFPTFFEFTIFPIEADSYALRSLDQSWVVALGYANINNLIWGKEFAFTYGPLSYLAIRIGWGANKYSFLLFDIFFFINLFFICFITYRKSVNKILVLFAIIGAVMLLPSYIGGSQALVLLLFLVFWIRQNIDEAKWYNYVFSIILLLLMFFIKFNTGLIAFLPYYGMLIYFVITKKEKTQLIILYGLIPLVSIFILSKLFNVDLYGYIISGIEMVSGYNEIMYLKQFNFINYQELIYVFIFLSLLFILIKLFLEKKLFLKNLFILCLFSLCLFIIYKQSFVRADIQHIMEFFNYIVLLILCFIDFFSYKLKNVMTFLTATLISIALFMTVKNSEYKGIDIKSKINKKNYFTTFIDFTPTSGMRLFPNNNQIPELVIKKIGDKTVDIYPWNIQLLFENKLNYSSRPVIQSYTSYTKYLEDLNFEHYNSKKAPKFVLFEYLSIDNRYPLFDETKMNLILLKNYSKIDSFTINGCNFILLEKNIDAKPIKLEFIREYAMFVNSPIIPKKDIYYEVELYHTLSGKIYSIFSHTPDVNIAIKTSNRKIHEFKTSNALLKSGLFSDKFIDKNEEFQEAIDSLNKQNLSVIQYNFVPQTPKYFKDKIRIKEYKITQ